MTSQLALAGTPFELLRKNFLASNKAPQISSFDNVASITRTKKCVSASEADTVVHEYFILRKFLRTEEGKPSKGPLFPGTPDTGYTTLIFTDFAPEKLPLNGFTVLENTNELIITTRDLTEQMYVRKNKNGFIFFHLDGLEEEYGYCF
jgi:hypothetical protein